MTKEYPIKSPRKLIEVALPLDAINGAAGREKAIRQGHPSSLHLWWARRPLVSARAVIFAQMVNDPGFQQGSGFRYGKKKSEAAKERQRLFKILEDLVVWENSENKELISRATAEIERSWKEVCELNKDHPQAEQLFDPETLPGLHDPFAGGGAIPFEAQRLGLEAYATDLNPVAVLINKAMVEIPPRFSGMPPANPQARSRKLNLEPNWSGMAGVASDVAYYGKRVREIVQKKIGKIYPPVEVTESEAMDRPDLRSQVGRKLPAIAWIWARTIKSPNPAFSGKDVPLVSTFLLSAKGSEAYVEPIIDGTDYAFQVKVGPAPPESKSGTKLSRGSFRCILSGTAIPSAYIKQEAKAGRMGARLMAVVAKAGSGRVYLSPTELHERVASTAKTQVKPDVPFLKDALGFRVGNYGMNVWSDLFTDRQLVALTTFSETIASLKAEIQSDAERLSEFENDETRFEDGGAGARAYSEAISVYLAFSLDKLADLANSLCRWESIAQCPRQLFGRQAIPMVWDFAEGNPLGDSSGSWQTCLDGIARAVEKCFCRTSLVLQPSVAIQADAASQDVSKNKVVCTDPPYYDNIGYADLSDFFYVWQRRTLRDVFPRLYATISVPKGEELVATPARHGGREAAEGFFLEGMTSVLSGISTISHPAFPVTIYYAFKQSETAEGAGTSSTGWVTFLNAVLTAGFAVLGTWPMRTENSSRLRGQSSNALASSVVLVCRRRHINAASISRREFVRELNEVLPEALDEMTRGVEGEQSPVAPVDLSQAIIGPGMAVFSKYASVLEADGSPMTVRTALQLINRFLAEDDFDSDTQFCLHWFEQFGWADGLFGEADVLARAKSTSVSGLEDAGVVRSGSGRVRLLRWSDYPANWNPQTDTRIPIWEVLHQLIRALRQGGEISAGALLGQPHVAARAEAARQLAYRLYTLCERKGWADDARAYNELITSWPAIVSATPQTVQAELFE